MRSAEQAHLSTVRHTDSRPLLARVAVAVLATLALLFIWRPVVVRAQETPPATVVEPQATKEQPPAKQAVAKSAATKDTASSTHVVKAGETLWSIASRYYGDGHQWRALARRNGIALSSDTALRIGTKLVIPARRVVIAAASTLPAGKDTTTPRMVTTPAAPALPAPPVLAVRPAGALTAQTAGKANAPPVPAKRPTAAERVARRGVVAPTVAAGKDSSAAQDSSGITRRSVLRPLVKAERMLTNPTARIGLVDEADLRAARPAGESATVFLLRVPDASVAAASVRSMELHAAAAPRNGEYAAAPFPIAETRWLQAGRLLRRLDDPGSSIPEPKRMQLADEVEITAPEGVTLSVGDRLVAVKNGGPLSPGVLVGVPTGIIEVTRVDAGRTVHAYVRSATGVIEQGEALFPIEGAAAPVGQRTEPVAGTDVETRVTWVDAAELLPTLQSYLMLAAGQAQGVKAGEEFALVRRSATGTGDRIAVARVVRVGALGSTAIIIRQSLPEIAEGALARRITRLP